MLAFRIKVGLAKLPKSGRRVILKKCILYLTMLCKIPHVTMVIIMERNIFRLFHVLVVMPESFNYGQAHIAKKLLLKYFQLVELILLQLSPAKTFIVCLICGYHSKSAVIGTYLQV